MKPNYKKSVTNNGMVSFTIPKKAGRNHKPIRTVYPDGSSSIDFYPKLKLRLKAKWQKILNIKEVNK